MMVQEQRPPYLGAAAQESHGRGTDIPSVPQPRRAPRFADACLSCGRDEWPCTHEIPGLVEMDDRRKAADRRVPVQVGRLVVGAANLAYGAGPGYVRARSVRVVVPVVLAS